MISQAIAYMAGYNMRLLTIIQSMTQLASAYGKDDAETIRANHSLLIMYAPNPTQQSLANEYSEMLGTQTVKSKSTSKGKGSTSTSESDQRRSLLLPQEIKGIGDKKEIVVLNKGSAKPILCQKIRYYEDPNFECRQRWETPFVPVQDVETFTASLGQQLLTVVPPLIKNPALTARFERVLKQVENKEVLLEQFLEIQKKFIRQEIASLFKKE